MPTIVGKAGTNYGLLSIGIQGVRPLPEISQMAGAFTGRQPSLAKPSLGVFAGSVPLDQNMCRTSYNAAAFDIADPYFQDAKTTQGKIVNTTGKLDAVLDRTNEFVIYLQSGQDPMANGRGPEFWEYVELSTSSEILNCKDEEGQWFIKVAMSDTAPS